MTRDEVVEVPPTPVDPDQRPGRRRQLRRRLLPRAARGLGPGEDPAVRQRRRRPGRHPPRMLDRHAHHRRSVDPAERGRPVDANVRRTSAGAEPPATIEITGPPDPGAIRRAADARTKRPAGPGRRPADDHRLRPPGPRRQRRRRPAAGHGQPRRPARPAADRAVPPRSRRAARQPGHHRGPAAARCAGGQGRLRVDEPRRPAGRRVRTGRPVHRLRRPRHRGRWASTAARP